MYLEAAFPHAADCITRHALRKQQKPSGTQIAGPRASLQSTLHSLLPTLPDDLLVIGGFKALARLKHEEFIIPLAVDQLA
jgi:hypothetical protein